MRYHVEGSRRAPARRLLVFVAVVTAVACGGGYLGTTGGITNPGPTTRPAKWGLVWQDEFDRATLDTADWIVVDGASNVNDELQYYSPADVYLENGALVLRSQRRAFGGRSYTSGEVRTGDRRTVTPGSAVEWRTQVPRGKGIWPANWLVHYLCTGLSGCATWPPEIDVVEVQGSAPTVNVMTHWWGSPPNQQHQSTSWASPSDLSAGYHTYRVEWFADSILWYVDGQLRAKHTQNITTGRQQLVMNTAVGGHFDGVPDGTTQFPQYHRIDYVRVFRDTANSN